MGHLTPNKMLKRMANKGVEDALEDLCCAKMTPTMITSMEVTLPEVISCRMSCG